MTPFGYLGYSCGGLAEQLKLDELSANAAMLSGRLRYLAGKATPLRAEQITFREELFHIRHTKDKYTDSDKVSFGVSSELSARQMCRVRPLVRNHLPVIQPESLEIMRTAFRFAQERISYPSDEYYVYIYMWCTARRSNIGRSIITSADNRLPAAILDQVPPDPPGGTASCVGEEARFDRCRGSQAGGMGRRSTRWSISVVIP